MSRQIQIRRGTTTEHSGFTGVIGEVTMDTDKKTLCVHDGATAGGIQLARKDEIPEQYIMPVNYDFVIETGGTSSAWYRKYKSGWIEQGGYVNNLTTTVTTVTFPISMSSSDYIVSLSSYINTTTGAIVYIRNAPTINTIDLKASTGTITKVCWEVKGWGA